MPELFLELFSEEIPARMQARAADDLARLVGEALAPLAPSGVRTFFGPRRIALAASVAARRGREPQQRTRTATQRPEQALAGFLRKHGASREQLREEGEFWVLDRMVPGIATAELIARELPGVLRRFPWPKSMRWGGSSSFTWVRPLRRILCILDGETVPSTCARARTTATAWPAAIFPKATAFSPLALSPLPLAPSGRRRCAIVSSSWTRPSAAG